MRKLIFQNSLEKKALLTQSLPAGEALGIAISRAGYQDVEFICHSTAGGAGGTATFRVTESDTSGGSYVDVTGATGVILSANAATKDLIIRVNCENRKAFLQLACVTAVQTAIVGGSAVLSNPVIQQPITQDTTPINA